MWCFAAPYWRSRVTTTDHRHQVTSVLQPRLILSFSRAQARPPTVTFHRRQHACTDTAVTVGSAPSDHVTRVRDMYVCPVFPF